MFCGLFHRPVQDLSGGRFPFYRLSNSNLLQEEEAAKSGRHCNNVGSEGWKVTCICQGQSNSTYSSPAAEFLIQDCLKPLKLSCKMRISKANYVERSFFTKM